MLTTFLAALSVLLLSTELEATVSTISLVKDLSQYKIDNPDVIFKALENVRGVGHALGYKTLGRNLLGFQETVVYSDLRDSHSFQYEYPEEIFITYVEVYFKGNVNGGQAFLVDGGIGQNFTSLVVEVPPSGDFLSLVGKINGASVSDFYNKK